MMANNEIRSAHLGYSVDKLNVLPKSFYSYDACIPIHQGVHSMKLASVICLGSLICLLAAPALACIGEEVCNPDGTANEQIGCMHNDNVSRAKALQSKLGDTVCKVFAECAAEFTGGGSGGHSDRVECASKKLDALEAKNK
jgi:hypothetical protein